MSKESFSIIREEYNNKKVIWSFEKPDRSGIFAFSTLRKDFDGKIVIDKLIDFSSMTWGEIKKITHGKKNKSKHHFLNPKGLSKDAKERISALHLNEWVDDIFSFALMGKLRIVGILVNGVFYVKWYDPEHNFHPVKK